MKTINRAYHFGVSIYIEYIIGLMISIIIARALGPNDYGLYAFTIWMCSLFIVIANAGINTAAIKFMAESYTSEDINYTNNTFKYLTKMEKISVFFVVAVSGIVLWYFWSSINPELSTYILIAVLIAIYFKAKYMYFTSVAKGIEKFHLISKVVIITAPINLVMVFTASFFLNDIETYIWLYMFICIMYLYLMRTNIKKYLNYDVSGTVDLNIKRRINKHVSIVSVNIFLSFIIFKQSEIGFLYYLTGQEYVSFYSIGFALASAAVLLVPGIYSALLLPLMSRLGANGKGEVKYVYISSMRYLFILSMPVLAIGIVSADTIVNIMYGKLYIEAGISIQICLISSVIAIIATSGQSYLMSSDRQSTVLKVMIVTAILTLILDYYFIINFGLIGALIANLISVAFISFFIIYFATKYLSAKLEYIVFGNIIASTFLSVTPLVLMSIFYGSNIYNMLFGIFLFIIIFFYTTIYFKCWTKLDLKMILYFIEKIMHGNKNIFSGYVTKSMELDRYHVSKTKMDE